MKSVLFMLILVLFTSILNSSELLTGSVKGKVIDLSTQQPLEGVNIIITGMNKGTVTNEKGEYLLEGIPPGRYEIRASMIGFITAAISEVIVNNVRPAEVDFQLQSSAITLNSITVRSDYFRKNSTEFNSVANFSFEEIRRSAGGFEDVVRAISALPGIAQAEAGRNDMIVRGGAPSENLYTVDNTVIPNINHFGSQGSSGGPLS